MLRPRLKLGPEEAKRASVAVDERRTAHGANLSVTEKPAQGYLAQFVSEHVCVVVRPAVEVLAPAQA